MSNKFISVVPAIRTIPGVDVFDYAVPEHASPAIGDMIWVPFRKKTIPGLIVRISESSPVADKAHLISHPDPLLRLDNAAADLLEASAVRTFTSRPSVLLSWIRSIPKRAKMQENAPSTDSGQALRETRFLTDRWNDAEHGLIVQARRSNGRVLVLTPWQHRAEELAHLLRCDALHAQIPDGRAWKALSTFTASHQSILVATRIGAWLACSADTVLVDEPENDDFKSDELSPRIDTRWLVAKAAQLRPALSLIAFSTTSRLGVVDTKQAPTIDVALSREPWKRRHGSPIELLSPASILKIEETIQSNGEAWIIHPIRGDRASIACRDCGWTAACAFCSFHLSQSGSSIICKRCGRKGSAPDACTSCGGVDFSRGQPGAERLAKQCTEYFRTDRVRVIDPMEFDRLATNPETRRDARIHITITDIALLAPGVEDVRRKERLIIAWRRLCASAATLGASIHVQGHEEPLAECADWLTTTGVSRAWEIERRERGIFAYPPTTRLVKLLINGPIGVAEALQDELRAALSASWRVDGPYPVEFRSTTRIPRHILHVRPPAEVTEAQLVEALGRWKTRALIDLDPIAFFS